MPLADQFRSLASRVGFLLMTQSRRLLAMFLITPTIKRWLNFSPLYYHQELNVCGNQSSRRNPTARPKSCSF